jgi:allantoicase
MSSTEPLPIGVSEEELKIPGTPGNTLGPAKELVPAFTQLIDLAGERIGGEALLCSDDFFAAVDNLVKRPDAEWKAGVMTERGKWMDGWETRRHNKAGVDWAILKLGLPGFIHGTQNIPY